MKKLLLLALSLFICEASQAQQARVVYLDFADSAVTTGAWTNIVPSLSKSIQGVSISNSSSVAFHVGIAQAGAAYGAEVINLVVPASTDLMYSPLYIPQGRKISVKAIGQDIDLGDAAINLINYFQ